jgi:hypothetical protein
MNNYLKYLITEELYLVNERQDPAPEKSGSSLGLPAEKLTNKTIIFIQSETKDSLSDSDQFLLSRILQAVNEDPDECIVFDLRDPGPHQNLLKNFHLNDCRILGFLKILPDQVGDVFAKQKYIIRSSGNFESLMADPLEMISRDHSRKKLLWEKLKDMFKR